MCTAFQLLVSSCTIDNMQKPFAMLHSSARPPAALPHTSNKCHACAQPAGALVQEPTKGKGTYKAKIGAADEEEEVVVSIMLPAAAQQGGSGQNRSFTSLDEVFVVVVKPLKRYVTYACSLSTPILV